MTKKLLIKKIVERAIKTPTSKLKTKKAEMGPREMLQKQVKDLVKKNLQVLVEMNKI